MAGSEEEKIEVTANENCKTELPTAEPKIPSWPVKKTKRNKNPLLPRPWSPLTFKEFVKGF
jgi:hypothetical protein